MGHTAASVGSGPFHCPFSLQFCKIVLPDMYRAKLWGIDYGMQLAYGNFTLGLLHTIQCDPQPSYVFFNKKKTTNNYLQVRMMTTIITSMVKPPPKLG